MDMFFQDDDETIVIDNQQIDHGNTLQSYEELVKDFMLEENQYLRELNMIIRVFREPFVRMYSRSKVLSVSRAVGNNVNDSHGIYKGRSKSFAIQYDRLNVEKF